jgi:hypothetical protein
MARTGMRVVVGSGAFLVAAMALLVMFLVRVSAGQADVGAFHILLAAAPGAATYGVASRAAGRKIKRRYNRLVRRALLPLVVDTRRVERLYAETVSLLEQPGALGSDEAALRRLLNQVNGLLADSRNIAARQNDVRVALGSLLNLKAEQHDLARRLEQASDPSARDTLRRSLDLCHERLDQTRQLLPLQERLDAQQEIIYQTLASVRATLARTRVALCRGRRVRFLRAGDGRSSAEHGRYSSPDPRHRAGR